MICKHDFHSISEVTKASEGANYRGIAGVEVVCANCGQVRRAFSDGTVAITKPGGVPVDEEVELGMRLPRSMSDPSFARPGSVMRDAAELGTSDDNAR